MDIGISTACFYPQKTEDAFLTVAKLGAKTTEIFFNSPSELEKNFIKQLCSIRDEYGIKIKSIHPFASFSEGYYFFSTYERRFSDSLEMMKKYFEAMNMLNAEFLVIHGAKKPCNINEELYCERFSKMYELGEQFNVKVAHENVVNYCSENPLFLKQIADYMGDKFKMVLDIKQAKRTGVSPYDFLDLLGEHISHIHISDYNNEFDCITPLKGEFDFRRFSTEMKNKGYNGDYMIELYEKSYNSSEEIRLAMTQLRKII